MIFHETSIAGAYLIEPERRADERGFFARTWCAREFAEHDLNPRLVQCSISFNQRRGTLRGMHYQTAPHEEAKLIRCTMGAILDVIIDLRAQSSTYRKHFSAPLDSQNRHMLYVPEGCAHGFQTLSDSTEVLYQMSEFFNPAAGASGVRWNDPVFGISWPVADPILNERDRQWPDLPIGSDR